MVWHVATRAFLIFILDYLHNDSLALHPAVYNLHGVVQLIDGSDPNYHSNSEDVVTSR